MSYEIREVARSDELSHHGILGQRWGIRRFQYRDGSLTPEGRKRYGTLSENLSKWKEKVKSTGRSAKASLSKLKSDIQSKASAQKQKRDDKKKLDAEKAEQKKQRLIERGTPSQIAKNIRLFNETELDTIQRRFDKELKVREQVDKIVNYGKPPAKGSPQYTGIIDTKRISDAIRFVSDTTKNSESTVSNAIKMYNGVAYAYNALGGSNSKMTIIPTKDSTNNNNRRPNDDD